MKHKVLHTNFHHGWGGQSNRILMECKGLAENGHDITISAPADSELIKRSAALGIKTFIHAQYQRGFHPVTFISEILKLRKFIISQKIEIVHTHGSQDSWTASFAVLLISKKNKPVLLRTKHNIFPIADHIINRLHYNIFDAMVCISESILKYCRDKKWTKKIKFYLIHSAVDIKSFESAQKSDIRKEFNLGDKILFSIIGRLRTEKGHVHLLFAIEKIIQDFPQIMFLFVGDGSLKEDLINLAKNLNIDKNVIFTGFRKDVPSVLKDTDVFILPSISEGLGTAILEAGMASLPVIASNVGGIPDIIDDNTNGYLVKPANPDDLAAKIKFVLNNMDAAEEMGKKLYQKIKTEFSPENLVAKTEQCYEDLLNGKK